MLQGLICPEPRAPAGMPLMFGVNLMVFRALSIRIGGRVTLRIYDVTGRLVKTLVDGIETPGRKATTWDGYGRRGEKVASGVYFYRMTAPGYEKTCRMVITR